MNSIFFRVGLWRDDEDENENENENKNINVYLSISELISWMKENKLDFIFHSHRRATQSIS